MNLSKAFAFSIALSALALVSGCQREKEAPDFSVSEFHEVVFHAGWDSETRTALQEDGSVWWTPGDEISLFVNSDREGGYKLTSVETEASPRADFRGEIPNIEGKYVAVYPYDKSTSYDKGTGMIVLQLPERQIAKVNTFPDKSFKCIAESSNDHLSFKNLFSGVKFTVVNEDIKEIEFSTESSLLSGCFSIDLEGQLTSMEACSNKVTIVAPENQCFIPGEYYFVVLPAQTLEDGLMITYRKETTEATLVLSDKVTFKKSIFKRVYAQDADLKFHKRVQKHATIPHWISLLPDGIDRATITEAHFHVLSDKTTETVLNSDPDTASEPIYFELNGTVADYYTSAEVYKVMNAAGLFSNWTSIQSLDLSSFDVSACTDFSYMFSFCSALKDIVWGDFNTNNARNMASMFFSCKSLVSLDLSGFQTSRVQNMLYMFTNCRVLKELDLSNFDTRNVTLMGEMFESCHFLEKLDISSFSSEKLEYAPGLFNKCYSMLKLNMGSFDISNLESHIYTCFKLASRSRNCAVLCTPATKEAMLSAQAALGNCEPYIQWFCPGDVLPDLSMNYDPNMYYSTDYSLDKKVKMLNVASEGNGIDIVIMGDAYSDRLIDDGTYERDMVAAMEQLFSVEPYHSFRHLFNVYMVNAVSENEVFGAFTALGFYLEPYQDRSIPVERDDDAIDEYVHQAVRSGENSEVTTLIVANYNNDFLGMGTTMLEGSFYDTDHFDYPAKVSGVAFVTNLSDPTWLRFLVGRQFGIAFAALHEENVIYEGVMETWESDYKKSFQSHLGWFANVSFTPDPAQVSWRRFLEEGSGYDDAEVSIIEGALFSQGIWKSVEQSMMNMGGEYSVPAREAIYKRIHKIAYGEDWQYSFNDFVRWDRGVFAPTWPTTRYSLQAKAPIIEHIKPSFQVEESLSPDGKKKATMIMNGTMVEKRQAISPAVNE